MQRPAAECGQGHGSIAAADQAAGYITERWPPLTAGIGTCGQDDGDQAVHRIGVVVWGGSEKPVNYTGGLPTTAKYQLLPGIQEWVFRNGTGNVSELLGDFDNYGSFRVLGNLSVSIEGVDAFSGGYNRSLDLETGVHKTSFQDERGGTYSSTVYCSYPDLVCVYQLSALGGLPAITVSLENQQASAGLNNFSCSAGRVSVSGLTQAGPPEGMKYEAVVQLVGNGTSSCSNTTGGALLVGAGGNATSMTLIIAAETNYDQKAGNAASNFSFKGADPGPVVERVIAAASAHASSLLERHVADYTSLASGFILDLPDTNSSAGIETLDLIARYNATDEGLGDPYVEALLFDYAKHLLISSARPGVLPANLQGKWSQTLEGAWAVDYHGDINLQMNYWLADQVGLGHLQAGLWDYLQDTWVPRGSQTAELLFNAPGWVTDGALNVFGHTGINSDARIADEPADLTSGVWMMQHVYDHFDYSQNTTWFATQGYSLVRGVAEFWLSQLQLDGYFNDGTLVVNPCNSPEQPPTTFGCTHYQQLIHQLLTYVGVAGSLGIETDAEFLANASAALGILDTGLHIDQSWGGAKEFKAPSNVTGLDIPTDTHRHLSHLVGWFPGYSIASLHSGFVNTTITDAVAASLTARGNGTGPDADAGWAKVWRAASWARLNNTDKADAELRYAIARNFAANGFSMYSAHDAPFQIDANFGLAGAMLSMLVVDLPTFSEQKKTVVLGPAIPARWGGGSVKGLRLRGGGQVDFKWDADGLVSEAVLKGRTESVMVFNKDGDLLTEV
ncbi:Glycoside hydrolase family 95 [Neofusicoccum parvum]|uniref:Glycoside hydrolase family 95 n=1 Tax=Neofusicoccum parvum TaxID=310453 RepID=A0ACB5SIH0_9PEZI|nr:Glycoside hydrolase family 95 [Neofusicoccum parvum]